MRQGRTRDNDVGSKSKEEECQVGEFAPAHTHNLEVGVAVWCVLLELAGNHGEEQDYMSAPIALIFDMGALVCSLPGLSAPLDVGREGPCDVLWIVAPEAYHHGPEIPNLYLLISARDPYSRFPRHCQHRWRRRRLTL